MDSNSQFRVSPNDSCFISPSVGEICQGSPEETTRDTMLNKKQKPLFQMLNNGTFDPCATLQSPSESCFFSFVESPKAGKGKGRMHDSVTGGDLVSEHDLRLALGLSCAPGSPNKAGSSASGSALRISCLEGGEQDCLQIELGLSLAQSNRREFTNEVSNVAFLRTASLNSEIQTHPHDSPEAGMSRIALVELESSHSLSWVPDNGSGIMKASCVSVSNLGENVCGMDLQLGLSGNSLSSELDCLSGMLSIGNEEDAQDDRLDLKAGDHAPLVDEGSTSARSMKSRSCIPSLLPCNHARVSQLNNSNPTTLASEKTKEPNLSGRKTSTVSASDCEAFADFSGRASNWTVTASSSGTLARASHRASKTCKYKGCGKGARGASGLCIAHGGGRRCQKPNCNRGAEGRTMYCKAHGGGRRCQSLGCIKSAEGKTDFCIGHGGGRRCNNEGCDRAARGKSGLCIRHGGGRRCQKEGCTKSAEGFPGLCISHGGGRRCQYSGCGKGAQGSTMFCKAHGGGRRCVFEGCTKGAEGSTSLCKAHGGGKRCLFGGGTCTKSVHGGTSFCVAHGGGKRCAVPGCLKSARGRTDYCVRHGGGKRCKYENCNKSAQGSTDFCKAHGGGKRCSWNQGRPLYSNKFSIHEIDDHLKGPCDRFARGKIGLCAAHTVLVQELRVSCKGALSSRGTSHDPLHGPAVTSAHDDENFQRLSDECRQPSQFAVENEHASGTVDAQYTRFSHEGSWSSRHMSLEGIPFDMNGTNKLAPHVEPPDCSPFSQFLQHDKIASSADLMDGTAARPFFPHVQRPHRSSGNTFLPPRTVSLFYSEPVCSSSKQKKDPTSPSMIQQQQNACPYSASNDTSNMFSLSVPEERVHGGVLMALLARGVTEDIGIQ